MTDIVPYEPAMAAELVGLYNEAVQHVPHCYPVAAEKLAHALGPAMRQGPSLKRLHSEAVFVARDGPSPTGFIHAAVQYAKGADLDEQGVVRFFCYRRGRRAAGQLLLDAAEDYLRRRGLRRVAAGWQQCCYPFYHLEPAYLSDRLDHVHALLSLNGYRRASGEVFLDWPDYTPPQPQAPQVPADITVEWRPHEHLRPSLTVRARDGRNELGVCHCDPAAELSGAPEAHDWVFTTGLGVEERVRGRGLGRHLLQRALKEARLAGYRHAVISTAWGNDRALVFYSNFGYRVVDWTYGLRRDLA